jgi:dihydroorotase
MVEKMSCNPSKVLGLERGTLAVGSIADITVIDPNLQWVVTEATLASKSKNSPFLGQTVKGAARYTVVGGKVVYRRD